MSKRIESPPLGWPEQECRALLVGAPWPIFIWSPDTGAIFEANEAAVRRYGYTLEEFARLRASDVVSAKAQPGLHQLTRYGPESPSLDLISEHISASGEVFPVEVTSFSVNWKGHPARFSLIRDHRPHVDLMRESSHLTNLENMARISGAIAHNFNNLLTIIQMAADELRESVPPYVAQQAELISNTVASANLLAQQLLHFGYRRPGRMASSDMAAFVSEEREILATALGSGVTLHLQLAPSSWALFDQEQCREVLLNLAVNAREAMPSGGTCTLAVHPEYLPKDRPDLDLRHGDYILLSFEDTGPGMNRETLRRAFEPYFSTKPQGHGLGLASVYGIMRLHRGSIEILSVEGKGTTLRLYFPASAPSEPQLAAPVAAILILEQNRDLSMLMRDYLQRLGYQVTLAHDLKLTDRLQEQAAAADLLICDLMLSDADGTALVEELLRVRPETRVILTSGDFGVRRKMVHIPGSLSLPKPFTLHQLSLAVSSMVPEASREGSTVDSPGLPG